MRTGLPSCVPGRMRPRPYGWPAGWRTGSTRPAATNPNVGSVPPSPQPREYTWVRATLLRLDVPRRCCRLKTRPGFDNIAGARPSRPCCSSATRSGVGQPWRWRQDDDGRAGPVGIDGLQKRNDQRQRICLRRARGRPKALVPLGEYVINLKRTQNEYIRGLGRRPQ